MKELEEFIKIIPPNQSGFLNKTFIDMLNNAKTYNIDFEELKELFPKFITYSVIMIDNVNK